jgi:phenylalanyl-tRNA synthetase beta chain
MKISYNWLQNYFEEKLPSPEEIREKLTFHSFEVEDIEEFETSQGKDYVLDIDILPNRASDCLSHLGVAKEVAVLFGLKLAYSNGFEKILKIEKIKSKDSTSLEIEANSENCIRYIGRIARGVEVKESPTWLREGLESIGQKSINILVDIANFLMFDLGQPIHVFDLDKLESEKILIRNAKEGEEITTLDKQEVKLDEDILLIADEKYPLAIAGIKGGERAETKMGTKNIVIEVANFHPTTTRKTARKINILTDAVKRYENQIHPELCEITMEAISKLIFNLAGGQFEEVIDNYKAKEQFSKQKNISINVDYINKYLGNHFTLKEIGEVFEKLNFEYSTEGNELKVIIPLMRPDLNLPCDLVEEVGRVLGYDRLKPELPEVLNNDLKIDETLAKILSVREYMLNEGYSEVLNYTFVDKGKIEVLASASDKNFLRTNLKYGLEASLKLNTLNAPLLKEDKIKIFEIGTVFLKDKEEIHVAWNEKKEIKEMELSEFCTSKNLDSESTNISMLRNLSARPGRPAQGFHNQDSSSLKNEKENISKKFKMWSLYPFIVRDIALWVPEKTNVKEVKKTIESGINELVVVGPYLFDEYKKDGRVSYAFRLVFQSMERTLIQEEVDKIVEKITKKLQKNKDWELR